MITIRIPKTFVAGFLAGIVVLVAINLYSYAQMKDTGLSDAFYYFGWPFNVYQAGSILHLDMIHWCGVFANMFVAVVAGAVVGIISAHLVGRRSAVS
jgi:hypothetical protein